MSVESVDIEELLEGPKGVLAMIRLHGEGRASGVPVDVRYAHAIELEDDARSGASPGSTPARRASRRSAWPSCR